VSDGIKSIGGIRRRLGTRKAVMFLRNRHEHRICMEDTWDMACYKFFSGGGEERDVVSDFNFTDECNDLDQWTR
jgi:hypothetical protein